MGADLTRDDLAAFVALWPKVFAPLGLVTDSTLKVVQTLRDLAEDGGTLTIHAPRSTIRLVDEE
jgi:hypothetical protein